MIKSLFSPKKNELLWLLTHIRRRIPALGLLTACKVLISCLSVALTLVIQQVIDSATAGDRDLFFRCCATMLGVMVIQISGSTFARHLQDRLTADLDRDFKRDLMHSILHSDYSAVSQYHSGDLLYRMNGDVSSVINSVLAIATSLVSLGSGLLAALVVLHRLDPGFTAAIFVICLVLAALTLLVQKHMKELHKKVSAASGKVSGFFQEVMENLLIVQALDVAPEIERRSELMLEERWQMQRRRKNVNLAMSLGSSILGYVASFITLVWCAGKLLRGKISFGTLTAMTSLVSQLQGPLLTLPTIIPKFVTIFASVERLMEIEAIPSQSEPLTDSAGVLYDELRQITVRNLSFSYLDKNGERKPVIQNVTCSIPKGGLTVITGASGIGKSTLLKLLLGIYQPDEGELLLETADRSIPLSRSSRKLFSYAPQGNLLLSGSIRENILLSRPDADEEALRQAVHASAMEEYLAQLPDGLDTVLGENGAGLSEGQVQRISLARAVLSGAPILLLDEVTSSLDPTTERIVLERIAALPNRTCVAVTHRPAVLKLADWELRVTEDSMTLRPVAHP